MDSVFEFASSLRKETKWHGNHEESDRQLILNAGLLSVIYENGNLRYISIGNHEIIRMIYSAVRDKEWLTIQPVISGEKFDLQPDSFKIEYNCHYKSEEINFSAQYKIEGKPDNSIIFSFEGEAMNQFAKNRIGFCVLHPVEGCSGRTCIITHSDGNTESLTFPLHIAPQQPFSDIRSMKWKISESDCSLVFSGDIFETEDQRNWTDASYKTYCTPLQVPFPLQLKKGEKIRQKIELKVEDVFAHESANTEELRIKVFPSRIYDIPMIGIGKSTRPEPLTSSEVQLLKKLKFDHYRIDLYLFSADWKIIGEVAVNEASRLEYPVEFVLFFDDNSENQASEFIRWISVINCTLSLITIFHKTKLSSPDMLIGAIGPMLKKALPGIKIGCGTNANFAQLNRERPESLKNDYISYSIQPQEHASDNTTLVENLQAQGYTVESAMQFSDGRNIWISPVNIQRRFNANTENYEQPCIGKDHLPQIDSRLMSLFGACWTTGSLKYLSEEGVKGMTFFETVGERGIVQGDQPSRWPEIFPSVREMIFPVYFVFQYILRYKTFKVIKSECSRPLRVDSLTLSDGKYIKIILANFTSSQQLVNIEGCAPEFSFVQLNNENFAAAADDCNWIENTKKTIVNSNNHLISEPYSVSFIEGILNV